IGTVTDDHNGIYTTTVTSSKTAHTVTITATDTSALPALSGRATLTQIGTGAKPGATNSGATKSGGPALAGPPVISGSAIVGRKLKASIGMWSGRPEIAYRFQWQRCTPGCGDIAGAKGSSYKLTGADKGAMVRVLVTASNGAGSAQAASAPAGRVV